MHKFSTPAPELCWSGGRLGKLFLPMMKLILALAISLPILLGLSTMWGGCP